MDDVVAPPRRTEAVKHYAGLVGALITVFLVAFVVVGATGVPVLTDPLPALAGGGAAAAAVGVGLLVADIVLPVPSSLVMLAHGALFGVVGGALLSLTGAFGAAMVGFLLGRRGSPLVARLVPARERRRADDLIEQWGLLAVIVSRPVPLFAETVAVMAGASTMPAGTMAVGTVIGAVPAAVLYAVAGALAAGFVSATVVFVTVLLLAALAWLVGRAGPGSRREPVVP